MNKLILLALLSFTIHAADIEVKINFTTKLKAKASHHLILNKEQFTLDGIKIDQTLLPTLGQQLQILTHLSKKEKYKCLGGTYSHRIIVDKNEKSNRDCIEAAYFGKLIQSINTIKRLQQKLL